jgi:hypothetical protein
LCVVGGNRDAAGVHEGTLDHPPCNIVEHEAGFSLVNCLPSENVLAYKRELNPHVKVKNKYRGPYMSALTPPHMFVGGHVTNKYKPRIFVGDVAPPMNIWGESKSNWTTHIFVGAQPKPMNINYIRQFWVPTNII